MSEKLDMQSPNWANLNSKFIAERFPNCVTESADGIKIDFDLLKQELSNDLIEGTKERYRLEWPGKKEAIVTANLPTTKTLRPIREDSVDFDNTENIYIEGDNLEVLKLLQESYLGKIKMIYIDPPYNTGKDFVYKDNFSKDVQDELLESGQRDESNQRLVVNPETSGRYHSDWLTMMYPRLKLSRNLLSDDGLIFISIDDNEVHNLRKICDDIFGEGNLIAQICHKARASVSNDKIISSNHNHILFYAKNQNVIFNDRKNIGLKPILEGFDKSDEIGFYKLVPVDGPGGAKKGNPYYEFEGVVGYWRFSKERMTEMYNKGQVIKTTNNLQQKYYLKDAENSRRTATTWWDENLYTSTATGRLKNLMESGAFDTPKPIELIEKMLELSNTKNSIVLDFFSGSATTAHSVMQLNATHFSNTKFIMVQVPENTDEKSEAFKSGYLNICEIGKERIRRAAKKIKLDTNADIDYGFRVYRLADSNMQDVYYKPQDYKQASLELFSDNVKTDRTTDDLLAQVMLDWGLPLSLKIEQVEISGKHLFKVAENSLYACFDKNIDEQFAKELAISKPLRVVFKDASFKDDTAKTNVKQLLKQLSPETEMKVI